MGADLIIDRDCHAKRALGHGDPRRGTLRILGMRKARSRAIAVAAQVQQAGVPLEEASVQVVVRTPTGDQREEVSVAEMFAQAAPLDEYAGLCADCPANLGREPYGCFGTLNYPIPASAERWLVERLQRAETLGGQLLLRAIDDFGYDGSPMARYREMGLFEAPGPARAAVKKGWLFGKQEVSSEQVLQAILAVGEALDPMHCALVLLWLGALEVDGAVPADTSPAPLQALAGMADPGARATRTRLVPGEGRDDPGVAGMQRMLASLHQAFVEGVPLLVDS